MLRGIVKNFSIDNFRIKNFSRRTALMSVGILFFFLISTNKAPELYLNPLTPNDLKASCSEPFKIKIHSKNMCEKPTNTPIFHSVY
jgi:hypothetical protein